MNRTIKLIWDFKGIDAKGIAAHHQIHLQEFANREKLIPGNTGSETVTDTYWMAFLIVQEKDMILVRDALRPNRGEIMTNT